MFDRGGDDVPADPPRASAPYTAVLTDSVPDAVNTTSRGRAPKSSATCSRATSIAARGDVALRVDAPRVGVVLAQVGEHRLERGRTQR